MQEALDVWVLSYNTQREHQSIGDMPPIRRFELAVRSTVALEVIDGEVSEEPEAPPEPAVSAASLTQVDASASSSSATTWAST